MKTYRPTYFYSAEDISKYISLGKSEESITLDFKRELILASKKDRNDIALEFAADICQFANTFGGSIIIGVEEKQNQDTGLRVANNFVNVSNCEIIKQFINDKVRYFYYPNNINYDIAVIEVEKNIYILAINVFPLIAGLSCIYTPSNPESYKYPIRTEYGKKYLKAHEIEARMNNAYRRIFLYMHELCRYYKDVDLLSPIRKEEKDPSIMWDNRDLNITIPELFQNEFELKVNDQRINIPYGLVKEIWSTHDRRIGLILDAEIIVSSDRRHIKLNILS